MTNEVDIPPQALEPTGRTVSKRPASELKGELDLLFPDGKPKYHNDYARILEFLSNTEEFERVFKEEVDPKIHARYEHWRNDRHRLMQSFVDVFESFGVNGFPRVFNIVMVDSAQAVFGSIIRNGFLFKDGTGPGHGEYTHILQWLTIAAAAPALKLETDVRELYHQSAGGPNILTAAPLSTLTSQGQRASFKVAYWNYLVDCFQAKSDRTEDVHNLFVSNYRSPGHFSRQLKLGGRLCDTFTGKHLQERMTAPKRGEMFSQKEGMRAYHTAKRSSREGSLFHVGPEGVNTFFPGQLLHEGTSFPSFSKSVNAALKRANVTLQESGKKSEETK